MVEQSEIQVNEQPLEPKPDAIRLSFGRVLKVFLVIDAALILLLTGGFLLPSKPVHDPKAGALPRELYDDTAKISPFTAPEPAPAQAKTDIPVITARGDHPTFVPVRDDAGAGDPPAMGSQVIPVSATVEDNHDGRVAPVTPTGARMVTVQPAHTS